MSARTARRSSSWSLTWSLNKASRWLPHAHTHKQLHVGKLQLSCLIRKHFPVLWGQLKEEIKLGAWLLFTLLTSCLVWFWSTTTDSSHFHGAFGPRSSSKRRAKSSKLPYCSSSNLDDCFRKRSRMVWTNCAATCRHLWSRPAKRMWTGCCQWPSHSLPPSWWVLLFPRHSVCIITRAEATTDDRLLPSLPYRNLLTSARWLASAAPTRVSRRSCSSTWSRRPSSLPPRPRASVWPDELQTALLFGLTFLT